MSRCINFSFCSRDSNFPNPDEAPIDILPSEMMIEIFKLLNLEEILQCEKVSNRWRKLAQDPTLWRRLPILMSGRLGDINSKQSEIINTHRHLIFCIKVQYVLNYSLVISLLNKCPNLVSLELVMCRMEKEFEEDIKMWPNLKKINLRNSLLKSDTDLLIQYDQFQSLNSLALSDFALSASTCYSLLGCPHLTHIKIEKIRGLSVEFIKILIKEKTDTLNTLHIFGGEAVDDECLFLLAQCPALKDLAIIHCEGLSDKALVGISKAKVIQCLQMWNNDSFSELMLMKTLEHPSLVTLRSLSLSKIENITPRVIDIISEHYRNLTFLALYRCPKIINTDYEKQLKCKFRNIDVVLY